MVKIVKVKKKKKEVEKCMNMRKTNNDKGREKIATQYRFKLIFVRGCSSENPPLP